MPADCKWCFVASLWLLMRRRVCRSGMYNTVDELKMRVPSPSGEHLGKERSAWVMTGVTNRRKCLPTL